MLKRDTFFFLVIASFFIFHNAFASGVVASQTTLGTNGVVIGSSFADGSGNEQFAISRVNFTANTAVSSIKLYQISRDSGATTTGQYPLLIYDSNHTTVLATSTNMLDASNLPTYGSGTPYDFEWTFSPITFSAGHTYYFGFQHIMPVLSGYIYIQSKSTCGTGNTYSPASGYTNGQYQWRTTCGGTANTDYPTTLGGLKYDILGPTNTITPTSPTGTIANNPVFFGGAFTETTTSWNSFVLNLTNNGINNDGIGGYNQQISFANNWVFQQTGLYADYESLGPGHYTYNISLTNTITGEIATTTGNISFILSSGAQATSTSATSTIPTIQNIATTTCTVWNALGCVQNALVYAFVPNLDIQRIKWQSLKDDLSNKPPFGWIGVLNTDINILITGTTTPAFTTVNLSGLDSVLFNPLKTAMSMILWVGLVFHIYRRIKHLQL